MIKARISFQRAVDGSAVESAGVEEREFDSEKALAEYVAAKEEAIASEGKYKHPRDSVAHRVEILFIK